MDVSEKVLPKYRSIARYIGAAVCVCLLNRCGNEILLKRSMSKRIQMLGVGKKDVNAQLEGVSEMKVFGGMALMLLLSIIPTIASGNATNEGSYWYG